MSDTNEETHRYEERDGVGSVRSWMGVPPYATTSVAPCAIDALPPWMRTIRDVALVGGHMLRNKHPPPTYILWFTTDRNHNLISFRVVPGYR